MSADPSDFFTTIGTHGVLRAISLHPLTSALLLCLAAVPLALYMFLKTDQAKWSPPFGLRLTRSHPPESIDAAKAAPQATVMWQVGVTTRSVCVSENGVLRCIEFTPTGSPPTVADVVSAIVSAIVDPPSESFQQQQQSQTQALPQQQLAVQRPKLVVFLESCQCSDDVITGAIEYFKDFGFKLAMPDNCQDEVKELRSAWMLEQKQKMKDAPKRAYVSQPRRVCFACRKEITAKATQCSACRAVIYCGAECAKVDWPTHKTLCPMWKATVKHAEDKNLYDFPFSFATPKLMNYNAAIFLGNSGVHNVGVYRRLCHCFDSEPYGELASQTQQLDDKKLRYQELGIPDEMLPLNKEIDASKVKDWKTYYDAYGLASDSPIALALECPLTVYNLLKKYYLSKAPAVKEDQVRSITIHMVNCSYEADLVHLFECLVPLFPSTDLTIHMIGPAISPRMNGSADFTYSFSNDSLKSTLRITVRHGGYPDAYLKGAGDFMNGVKPDIIIALNAPVLGGPGKEQFPWKAVIETNDVQALLTVTMEAGGVVLENGMRTKGVALSLGVTPNEFRQPVVQFAQDLNLPAFSNGFVFGFH